MARTPNPAEDAARRSADESPEAESPEAESAAAAAVGAADETLEAAVDEATVIQRVASAIGDAVDSAKGATSKRLEELPGARVRRVRRLGKTPLRYLYDVHPEARYRPQRELGLRTIDLADIAGTAVGGAQQRGGDFLPLKPFRSLNWQARWQRLRKAAERLAVLPPIDVLRYRDRYWVLDGHNRVALGLYTGQLAIDASVDEIIPPGQTSTEAPESFEALVDASRDLRAAVSRKGKPGSPETAEDEPDQ